MPPSASSFLSFWCARGRLLSACLLVLASPATWAQAGGAAVAPLPAERFFQHPVLTAAKLSPSGKQLAITTSRGADRVGLFVVSLSPSVQASRVAQFKDLDVAEFDWTSDERLVFSLVDLKAGSGGDRTSAPGLVSVKADGTEMLTLVSRQGRAFMVDAGNRSTMLEANHRLLLVPRQQAGVSPDEVIVGRYEFRAGEVAGVTPLWLNVASGRTRAVPTGGAPDRAMRWWFDSRGQPRAVQTVDGDRQAFHWRGPTDAAWRLLAQGSVLDEKLSIHDVDDAGTLYVTHPEGAQGQAVLSKFDFTRMAPEAAPLVRTPGFDFTGTLLKDFSGGQALGVRVITDAEETVWLDPSMKALQAQLDQRLPGRVNRISCRRCGQPDMVALVRSYSDRDPGEYWLYEAASKRLQVVMRTMDGIDPRQMGTVEFRRITARDGRDLPVWVTLPPGFKPGQPAPPAVVMVHGGPWVRGGNWVWSPTEQFLASRGYAVIAPEFRGSTGFGQSHFRAGFKQWGQAMQDDVADALLWARKEGLAGPKACIAGASYGGYATLMGLVRHPELWRCGAAWVAVTDLVLLVQGSWWVEDDVSRDVRRLTLPQMVGDPKSELDMLKANSPVEQAARIKAPLFLAFGEQDVRVPLEHGKRMREALIKAGNPPEWVTYPDEAHGWRQVSAQVDFATRLERFLARHLGP